jgi:hypothetical protein
MARRKESETVQLAVRMKEPLRAALEEAARRRGVSMNAETIARLERSFEQDDRFGGAAMLAMANLMAGAFLRGGQLGAAAQGHPEWTPDRWVNDAVCYRAGAWAVASALGLPLPGKASMSDPAAVHDVLTAMVAHGAPFTIRKEQDK